MLFLRIRFIPYLHELRIYAFFLSHRLHFLQDFDEFVSFFTVILFFLSMKTNDSTQHASKNGTQLVYLLNLLFPYNDSKLWIS